MFEPGRNYNRRTELHQPYGGQQQGGISTPANHQFLFLFTGESGEQHGYSDGWNTTGVFLYTGEGLKGDMEFVRGNLAIRDHAQHGKALYLFESLGKGMGCRYIGEFVCASWENRRGNDTDGADRQTIVFHLVPVDGISTDQVSSDPPSTSVEIETLRQHALDAGSVGSSTEHEAKRIVYRRSEAVKNYVLARADGICESCRNPAPFQRADGSSYLEPQTENLSWRTRIRIKPAPRIASKSRTGLFPTHCSRFQFHA